MIILSPLCCAAAQWNGVCLSWLSQSHVSIFQASTVNRLGRNVLHSHSEIISLWNQLVKNEIHLENNEQAKLLSFKIKSTKQEFNFTASYQNLPMVRKKNKSNFFDSALFS